MSWGRALVAIQSGITTFGGLDRRESVIKGRAATTDRL